MKVKNYHPQSRSKKNFSNFKTTGLQLSSFTMVNQGGGLALKATPLAGSVKKAKDNRAEFLNWSMPEQESGYIKCKKHDFL